MSLFCVIIIESSDGFTSAVKYILLYEIYENERIFSGLFLLAFSMARLTILWAGFSPGSTVTSARLVISSSSVSSM